jgi:hypothetical protein
MNNFQYQNIDEIINATNPIRGSRFFVRRDKRIIVPEIITQDNQELNTLKDSFELHVFYADRSYLGSLYDIKNWNVDDIDNPQNISLNVLDDIETFNLQNGRYTLVYNFFRNLVSGTFDRTKLFISEISQDRKEITLALTDPTDAIQIEKLTTFVLEYLKPKKYLPPLVLNFGENKILDVVNISSDGSQTYFYAKLMFPLPDDIDLRYECWLAIQLLKPYIDQIEIVETIERVINTENVLKGPNYNANYQYNMVTETDYKSWTDLLSTNVNTSQEILSKFINGDQRPVRLNIDFSSFSNFCFYSSAKERVENFFYKIQLLEGYRNEISSLSGYMASTIDIANSVKKINDLIDKVLQGFDEWEKWLYYEDSPSNLTSITETNIIVPFPKYDALSSYDIVTKSGKYKLYEIADGPVQRWYEATLILAEEFDKSNDNALIKVFPDHITLDSENQEFVSFINMIGQHFDVIYTYTEHILKKNLRKESTKDGLSQDLIKEVTEHFGWKLSSNTQDKNLWEYVLGLNDDEENRDNVLGKKYNKTEEERTKEVWRRILNNLPFVYRTKGTSRGIRALIAAYGIPQTLLSIREYGGAYSENTYDFKKKLYEKPTYYLNIEGFVSSSRQKITVPWEKVNYNQNWIYPDSVSFRWKMEPDQFYNYTGTEQQTVLQKSSSNGADWFVTINNNGTDPQKGSIVFYISSGSNLKSTSIIDEYIFDDTPLNILITRSNQTDNINSNQKYEFILKTEKYGKLSIEKSGSIDIDGATEYGYNQSWSSNGKLHVGSGINSLTQLPITGSVFELRYWSNPLNQNSFNNHVLSARSYNGNDATSSFYDLQAQWKFWQPFDLYATNSLFSSHPNQKYKNFETSSKQATLIGFTSESFEPLVESYLMEVANVGAHSDYGQKIRIESSSLGGALSMHNSYERTSLKRNSLDSNRLMVAFSPQHIINEDIYEAIGGVDISEFIGDYSTIESDEYINLKMFANEYWQKYDNKNDFNAYISIISQFDFSVFEQIAQTIPIRTNEILGLVIEPNILERSKTLPVRGFKGNVEHYQESNDISMFPTTNNSINLSNKTTLFIGFEDGDIIEVDNVQTEEEILTNVISETDEVIKEGEHDVDIKKKGEAINRNIKIKIFDFTDENGRNGKFITKYKTYSSTLKTELTDNNIFVKSQIIPSNIKINDTLSVKSSMVNINGFYDLNLKFKSSDKNIFIVGSNQNEISNYEKTSYYDTVYSVQNKVFLKNDGYNLTSGSSYIHPNSLDISKRNREFFGCNDYAHPYKKVIQSLTQILAPIRDFTEFTEIYENFERISYDKNNVKSLKYNDVYDYRPSGSYSIVENDIFPKSDYWKTYFRGNYLTSNTNTNVYGMVDSAPRIIKLKTEHPDLNNKNLFSPLHLQESVIVGTKKYLNYPASPEYVRSFPWVLIWSGSNDNVPNIGPDYGFTQRLYINLNNPRVTNPNVFPQIQ